MNLQKLIFIAILFGLVKLCHAGVMSIVKNTDFQLPPSKANQVSVYPCLSCPCQVKANSSTNCLTQAMQGGVGVHIVF
jgi:hypothetical protein